MVTLRIIGISHQLLHGIGQEHDASRSQKGLYKKSSGSWVHLEGPAASPFRSEILC